VGQVGRLVVYRPALFHQLGNFICSHTSRWCGSRPTELADLWQRQRRSVPGRGTSLFVAPEHRLPGTRVPMIALPSDSSKYRATCSMMSVGETSPSFEGDQVFQNRLNERQIDGHSVEARERGHANESSLQVHDVRRRPSTRCIPSTSSPMPEVFGGDLLAGGSRCGSPDPGTWMSVIKPHPNRLRKRSSNPTSCFGGHIALVNGRLLLCRARGRRLNVWKNASRWRPFRRENWMSSISRQSRRRDSAG